MVRFAGAEGGRLRVYLGKRERAAFRDAVRAREHAVAQQFARAGWRTGALEERNGVASLHAAFGVP
jgi:hypothetical protein